VIFLGSSAIRIPLAPACATLRQACSEMSVSLPAMAGFFKQIQAESRPKAMVIFSG
jgi:hypothetical protein